MENQKKIMLRDLNDVITCRLCEGYFVDATTLVECLHTFCRSCILRYFENSTYCPTCNTVYKKKTSCLRPDTQIQTLVYKAVPSLFIKEMQRREEFNRSIGVRASSSCSDDSVLERERDTMMEQEEMVSIISDKTQFYSADDLLSLSLEYYQHHLDTTDAKSDKKSKTQDDESDNVEDNVGDKKECDKRYLQCPAVVTMRHLQKFVRMKYGLTAEHRVDIIYKGEVLPLGFSLMDVAYTFKWGKKKPMRFFYRIFTPMKVRPIKIVNTTLSTGGKQLQIVPIKPTNEPPKVEKPEKKEELTQEQINQDQKEKERLLAHLQLQCKNKVVEQPKAAAPEKPLLKEYIFEYETPDPEAAKRFAEKRDREWALQKKLEEETRQEDEHTGHHFSKKRKKSKHSKNEFNPHKKRKLHAEITSNEKEDLKLKVKITTNGHKHKHHKNNADSIDKTLNYESSSKEKLLQMRQVRHKHQVEEKEKAGVLPVLKVSKDAGTADGLRVYEKPKEPTPVEDINKNRETKKEAPEATKPKQDHPHPVALPKPNYAPEVANTSRMTPKRPELAPKQSEKWGNKVATVQLERNEQTEKQAQRTFKTFAEKYQKNELKTKQKIDAAKPPQINRVNTINTNDKNLDRKIASLQQRCTIEPKNPQQPKLQYVKPSTEIQVKKQVTFHQGEKPKTITPQYPPGFTVSKIEAGVKRKAEDSDRIHDKRPSLEITLISPAASSPKAPDNKPLVKRPPPATIPLERIKKSVSIKSAVSIIPKQPERCDNIGALDLSKPNKLAEPGKPEQPNGIKPQPPQRSNTPEKNGLSNLRMLSNVATEHPAIAKPGAVNRQMPNLQNIGRVPPSLQRLPPPKLAELQRQFRATNPQIRNLRPNQNQNIRNIPNPSLLLSRQQNQRMAAAAPAAVAAPPHQVKADQQEPPKETPKAAPTETTAVPEKSEVAA